MTEVRDVVVIGAGPAGLATAACLRRAGLDPVVIEREQTVGSSWRGHYDRLHLHTAKDYSALPGMPFPHDYPTYPARAQVVSYLERYAAAMGVAPRFGVEVTRAQQVGARWRVETNQGDLDVASLVVATGYNRTPERPSWPGLETFPGPVVHSSDYKDGRHLQGQRVLVVGSGNSGAEIAIDLWESGAVVAMVFRSPVHVVPRDAFGQPAQRMTLLLSRLPTKVADRLSQPLRDLTVGDLSPYGIARPAIGPLELLEKTGRVPLIDIGTIALIKQGAITVYPNIAAVTDARVRFVDGRLAVFDAIVLATGYRAGLTRWLHGVDAVLDERGLPRQHGRETLSGLYFCGFKNPTTGALREVAIEAERIATSLASRGQPAARSAAGRSGRGFAHGG